MRSLVPVQMASRLVAGLAHIFLFRKLCKKLRPHRREFCTEFFKPIPMDGHKAASCGASNSASRARIQRQSSGFLR